MQVWYNIISWCRTYGCPRIAEDPGSIPVAESRSGVKLMRTEGLHTCMAQNNKLFEVGGTASLSIFFQRPFPPLVSLEMDSAAKFPFWQVLHK